MKPWLPEKPVLEPSWPQNGGARRIAEHFIPLRWWWAQTNLLAGVVVFGCLTAPWTHAAGTITAWGSNSSGQTAVPAGLNEVVSVAAGGNHSLALLADGTVVAWGDNGKGQSTVPAGLNEVVAVSAGGEHSLGLLADGTVIAWGDNGRGQTSVPPGLVGVVAIAAGGAHNLALLVDGTVRAWGYNADGQTTVPAGLKNVVAVAAGRQHSLALLADGTVRAWGFNSYGQTTVPPGLDHVVAITAGGEHSLALLADGTVVAWGLDGMGQTTVPGDLSAVVAVTAGGFYSLALQEDGTMAAWGWNHSGQTTVPAGLSNVMDLAAAGNTGPTPLGGAHNLAVSGPTQPMIFQQPVSRTNDSGTTAWFSVAATGVGPLAYQWRLDGANLVGATGRCFIIPEVQAKHGGRYSVVVSNSVGVAVSSDALFVVVGSEPSDEEEIRALYARLESRAAARDLDGFMGCFAAEYVHSGSDYASLRESVQSRISTIELFSFNIERIETTGDQALVYASCIVAFDDGEPPSTWAEPNTSEDGLALGWLRKTAAGWRIIGNQEWASVRVQTVGGSGLSGGGMLRFRAESELEINSVSVSGPDIATTPLEPDAFWGGFLARVYFKSGALPQVGTEYVFDVALSDGTHQLLRDTVKSWVLVGPTISVTTGAGTATIHWTDVSAEVPDAAHYWVRVGGDGVYWESEHLPLSRTSISFNEDGAATGSLQNGNRYLARVYIFNRSDDCAEVGFEFTMDGNAGAAPTITGQPQSQTVISGQEAEFTVLAFGTAPLAYQWYFNTNTLLVNATNSTLIVANVQVSDGGGYSVVVSNDYGSVTSSVAVLTLESPAPFTWARRVASTLNPNTELAIGMALDNQGDCYVTGWFDGTNDFGGLIRTSLGAQDLFVAKYASNGALQWVERAGSSMVSSADYWDQGRGIGVDSTGNVYVTGGFQGSADFGPFVVTTAQNMAFFLAKYNSAGGVQWVRQSVGGRSFGVYGTGLAVDSTGDSYAVGFADNGATITFGTVDLLNQSATGYSTFLVKYDNAGTVQWAKLMGGTGHTYATKVAVDGAGNVHLRGAFENDLTIGSSNLVSSGSWGDMFIAKFDNAGALTWVRQSGGADVNEGGVAVDQAGNMYVTGWFSGKAVDFGGISLTNAGSFDAFVGKYSSSGALQWARRAGGADLDIYWDAALDGQGNVYAAGALGSDAVGPSGSVGAMVAKYDPAGTLQWAYSASGPPADPVGSMVAKCAVDSAGNCYLAGWYQGTVTFGTNVLQPQGYWNFFLAKLGVSSNTAPRLTVPSDLTVAELTTLVVTNTATDVDIPTNRLTFSLLSAPSGMSIDPQTGVITWMPLESQGPSTNRVIVVVADDGLPPLSATNSITLIVQEINQPPELAALPDQYVHIGATLTVAAQATDSDLPANLLTFDVLAGPSGLVMDPASGVLTWIPTEAAGPGSHAVTVRVTDFSPEAANGKALSATRSFTIHVRELRLQALRATDGLTLSLDTLPGQNYGLESCDDLGAHQWTPVAGYESIHGTGDSVDLTLPMGTDRQRYYRIVLLP